MWMKQAIVDGQREVDEQIARLLLRSVNCDNYNNNDNDDDDEAIDAVFGQDTRCWFSSVDHTPSTSAVEGCYQTYYQRPVHDCITQLSTPGQCSVASSTTTSLPRRRRTRHPHSKAAVSLMRSWYDEHRSRPYASDAEVRRLAAACQLTVRQVQKWLSNQRRMDGNTRRRNRPAHNAKRTAADNTTTVVMNS